MDDDIDDIREQCHQSQKYFENVFHRLLAGETLDLYAEGVSAMFEIIAANLLADFPEREFVWYDGVDGLTARVKTQRQVEFDGEMWVADDRTQWKEDFRATITDKSITKQGIWVIVWLGSDRVEAELSAALDLHNESALNSPKSCRTNHSC